MEGAVNLNGSYPAILCLCLDVGDTPGSVTSWKCKAWLVKKGRSIGFNGGVTVTSLNTSASDVAAVEACAKYELAAAGSNGLTIHVYVEIQVDDDLLLAHDNRLQTEQLVPEWVVPFLAASFARHCNPLPHLRGVIPGQWSFQAGTHCEPPSELSKVYLDKVLIWEGRTAADPEQ